MPFQEHAAPHANLLATPIRDLGLKIEGTPLEPIVKELTAELRRAGVRKLQPRFYLSNEWGVPFGTTAVAIPFYLARPDLTDLHAEQAGYVEGTSRADILRYLRHEVGHAVNYGYRLYESEDWIKHFGSITQPYLEEYRPVPYSRRFVRHLPGFYAQKHPDEDWAETFAVRLTPGRDWRAEYRDWPTALAKLEYCDRVLSELGDREPLVTAADTDEAVDELAYTLKDYYQGAADGPNEFPPGLDGALRAIFEDLGEPEGPADAPRRPAAKLIRRLERGLLANVYCWTGHFPERTRALLRFLAQRAEQLNQVYPADRETAAAVALTTLVTALAMNHVHHNSYMP